tara:strand:- start:670 stop:927 length:258 start_codon:yes stop_codon:yes gene_type:complete
MLTMNADKNPRMATNNSVELKKNDAPTPPKQKTSMRPLYGSVVNALDKRMGICVSHVILDTSTRATRHNTIRMHQAINHSLLSNI